MGPDRGIAKGWERKLQKFTALLPEVLADPEGNQLEARAVARALRVPRGGRAPILVAPREAPVSLAVAPASAEAAPSDSSFLLSFPFPSSPRTLEEREQLA